MQLDSYQLRAVQSTAKQTLIIAGVACGKTRTLVERIGWLIEQGVPAERIACVTFTNAAAAEVQRRLANEKTQVPINFCGTLHSLMFRYVCASPKAIGYAGRIIVIDEEQAEEILKEIIEALRYKGTQKEVYEALGEGPGILNRCVLGSDGFGPPTAAETVAMEYHRKLRADGLMDFDNILHYGLAVLLCIQDKTFSHVLVDEVQDSGDLDMQIYGLLGAHTFFSGDFDQSVFSWRGGNNKHILRLSKTSTVFTLPNNYRSDRSICRAAEALISHNTERIAKPIVPQSTAEGVVTFFGYATELSETGALLDALTKINRPNDCAVLVRTNWLVSRYADALRHAGIPVAEKAQLRRPQDWRAARDMLMLLADPLNDHLAYRVLARMRGKEIADKTKLSALEQFKSINTIAFGLPLDSNLGSVLTPLAQARIGPESIALIQEFIIDNPSLKTVAELTVALAQDDLSKQEQGEGVVVTTLHGFKGREKDHIWLPAFNEGVIPSKRKDEDIQESRRLAFVGVTRAKHTLTISWANVRTEQWKREPVAAEASRFVQEMQS